MENEKCNTNLQPFKPGKDAREKGRLGGLAAAKSRRKKKMMKEVARLILSSDANDPDLQERLAGFGLDADECTNQMKIIMAMFDKAVDGDVKAAKFVRDTAGESPELQLKAKEYRLKKQMFDYQKEKDAGALDEIEDMDSIEDEIYGES